MSQTTAIAGPAIRFSLEPFSDALLAEMLPLLTAHWREVAHYLDIPLQVDAAVYHAAQANGALRIFTLREAVTATELPSGFSFEQPTLRREAARLEANSPVKSPPQSAVSLIGYAVYFVKANPHYAGSLQAVQDVIYVDPRSRGKTGAMLVKLTDRVLRAEGVQVVYHHSKLAHDFGPLLVRLGYEAVETIYAKRLDRPDKFALGAADPSKCQNCNTPVDEGTVHIAHQGYCVVSALVKEAVTG